MKSTISIVVPLFNRKDLISETIESVINQSSPNWELIIVDDGSNDGADEIAKEYSRKDRRIKFIKRNREPKGAPTCRNIGVQESLGDYLIFLDSDDLLAPWCIENRLEKFQKNSGLDFLVFPMQFFEKMPGDKEKFWNILEKPTNDIDRFLNFDTPWQTTCPIWKKKSFERMGGTWKEEIKAKQDVEFHVRALAYGLKYKKFGSKHDCYYRSAKNISISRDVLVTPEKINSWLEVLRLSTTYLKSFNLLTPLRAEYLAINIIKLGLEVFGLNRTFFTPSNYLNLIKKHNLLPMYRLFYWFIIFYGISFLYKLGLNRVSVFCYGKIKIFKSGFIFQ